MAGLLALLVGFSFIAGVMILSAAWRGWVLSVVWGWLVVPIFHLAPITVLGAVTISLIVSYLTHQETNAEPVAFSDAIAGAISGPAVVLIFAWVAKMFL